MVNLWRGAKVLVAGSILLLNTWTHIDYTYSSINGIRLYINGTQYSASTAAAGGTAV